MTRRNDACPHMLSYRPPRIAMSLLATAALLQSATPASWPALPGSLTGGLTIAAVGFLIMLRAWWVFRARGNAICPTARTSLLITDDVFRLTRNPMYLGIVLMLLGMAMGTGGLFFYLAAMAFFLIIDFVFCPYEEAKLGELFGERFDNYQSSVRRWL